MKNRGFWVTVGLALALLIAALLGTEFALRAFIHSDWFREAVARQLGERLQAEVNLTPLQWQKNVISSEQVTARGRPGALFANLSATDLRTAFRPRFLFKDDWDLGRITAAQVRVTLPATAAPAAAENLVVPAAPDGVRLSIDEVAIERLAVVAGDGTNRGWQVTDTRWTARPEARGWNFTSEGGLFKPVGFPVFQLRLAVGSHRDGVFEVSQSDLTGPGSGTLTFQGRAGGSGTLAGRMTWKDLDLPSFLLPAWRDIMTGKLSGEAVFSAPAAGGEAGGVNGRIHISDASISKVPALVQLGTLAMTPGFARVPIESLHADFIRDPSGTLVVRNFSAQSSAGLRLEGEWVVRNGVVAGKLNFGVRLAGYEWLSGVAAPLFVEERDGYLWTPVSISGTSDRIDEDLTRRIAAAISQNAVQAAAGAVQALPGVIQGAAQQGLGALLGNPPSRPTPTPTPAPRR